MMRFQQLAHFVEYKNNLHKLVPAWESLNDALFWRGIEEARARSFPRSEHYSDFKAERFDDVLGFITTRDLLDDKLVALSRAYQLFVQSGKTG